MIKPPSLSIVIVESCFIFSIIIFFILTLCSYKEIIAKVHKSKKDIKKRQELISRISFLLVIFFTAIPFILNRWGIPLFPSLENVYFSQGYILVKFIKSGIFSTLLIIVGVFFVDSILKRITQAIYCYDDVKNLDKFCLYLRSFDKDNNREEKLICKVTRNLYPVYAIGDPNKILQPNGAERIYVTDEVWQVAVADMSNKSKLILLRIGQTEGTKWELNNIINLDLISKVIFIIYNVDDYNYFSKKIAENLKIEMPIIEFFDGHPHCFYFIINNSKWLVNQYKIIKSKDVENMLNQYLKDSPELDKNYTYDLELRKHNLKYLFDKKRIPLSVRKSLNWGCISPIVNMRHWSLLIWAVLFIVVLIAAITQSFIPYYLFFLVNFLIGNRIEWAAGGWSCADLFLKHQRREAKLIWLSMILGGGYSLIYIILWYIF